MTWRGELRQDDVATVGGKGANLGELTHREFPVTPGFVVTVAGYLQAMEDGGVGADLEDLFTDACSHADDPVALADASGRLQALVRKAGMPDASGSTRSRSTPTPSARAGGRWPPPSSGCCSTQPATAGR